MQPTRVQQKCWGEHGKQSFGLDSLLTSPPIEQAVIVVSNGRLPTLPAPLQSLCSLAFPSAILLQTSLK